MDASTTSQTAAPGTTPNGHRARFPLLALTALLAALALVAGACSDSGDSGTSKESDSADATSEGSGDPTDGAGSDSGEADPGDAGATRPGENEAAIAQLGAASTTCDVFESVSAVFSTDDPTTTEESKAFADNYVTAVTKMADTTDDPQLAARLGAAAANIRQYSEDAGYDPAVINSQVQPDYEAALEDFAAIEQWMVAASTECTPDPAVPTP
jgi:hypothetical protein